MKLSFLSIVCLVLSVLAIVAGGLGMLLSFLALAQRDMRDITAGASGFVAGAVLIGAGLVSLAILATRAVAERPRPDPPTGQLGEAERRVKTRL